MPFPQLRSRGTYQLLVGAPAAEVAVFDSDDFWVCSTFARPAIILYAAFQFSFEEEWVQFVAPPVLAEDEYFPPPGKAPWKAVVFTDDEILSISLEEDRQPPLQVTSITWTARPFSDDEVVVQAPVQAVEDDPPFVAQR